MNENFEMFLSRNKRKRIEKKATIMCPHCGKKMEVVQTVIINI